MPRKDLTIAEKIVFLRRIKEQPPNTSHRQSKNPKNLDRAHLINIFINTVNKNLRTLLVYAFACLFSPLLLVCLFVYCL